MNPITLLIDEHGLIRRLLKLIYAEINKIKTTNTPDPIFIVTAVDFFKSYADKTHHGKEEDILFREISQKPISEELKKTLGELVEEHVFARQKIIALLEANKKYMAGDTSVIQELQEIMTLLCDFYPKHMIKEETNFFVPVMNYFSDHEIESMLKEFFEFDRNIMHEKYRELIEQLESR